jgi:protein-disulfide isomerase
MRRLLLVSLLLLAVPALASDSGEAQACDHGASCPEGDTPAVSSQRFQVVLRGAPSRGPANAKVTLVVFSDFQCPFCARGAKTVKALEAKYGQRLRVVFKNQPLPRHAQARLAADAALAANAQGHFWELHDWLFSTDAALDTETLVAEAARLGMDGARLRADLDSGKFEAQVSADQAEAKRLGVEGTPTYFINGLKVTGAQPVEVLGQIIDAELAR